MFHYFIHSSFDIMLLNRMHYYNLCAITLECIKILKIVREYYLRVSI